MTIVRPVLGVKPLAFVVLRLSSTTLGVYFPPNFLPKEAAIGDYPNPSWFPPALSRAVGHFVFFVNGQNSKTEVETIRNFTVEYLFIKLIYSFISAYW